MNKSILRSSLLLVGLLALTNPPSAHADLIAADGFSYPNGNLAGNNGGTGFAGAWTGGGTVSGGVATTDSSSSSVRSLLNAIVPTAGETIYVGFSFTAITGAANGFAGLEFNNNGQESLFLGMPFTTNDYGIAVPGLGRVDSGVPVSSSLTYLVTQIEFNSSDNFTVNLYVNPIGSLGTPNATVTANFVGGGNFDSISLDSGSDGNTTGSFTNLKIGTQVSDVLSVPEPSSFVLCGLGGLCGLADHVRRRRTSRTN